MRRLLGLPNGQTQEPKGAEGALFGGGICSVTLSGGTRGCLVAPTSFALQEQEAAGPPTRAREGR